MLAALQVCVTYDCTGAMVVGDTVVLQPHVTYEIVAREVHEKNAAAGMWRYGNSFAGIEEWVMDCREELGRTFRRRDDVRSKLKLELPAPSVNEEISVYTQARGPSQETAARFDLVFSLSPSRFVETDFRQPAEPAVVSHISTNLGKLWEAYVARQARDEHEFADLPPSAIQLAKWKYGAATHAV